MEQPDMVPELKPYESEVMAAIRNSDMEELRRIVEKAGLTWVDAQPCEKYMFEDEGQL